MCMNNINSLTANNLKKYFFMEYFHRFFFPFIHVQVGWMDIFMYNFREITFSALHTCLEINPIESVAFLNAHTLELKHV